MLLHHLLTGESDNGVDFGPVQCRLPFFLRLNCTTNTLAVIHIRVHIFFIAIELAHDKPILR